MIVWSSLCVYEVQDLVTAEEVGCDQIWMWRALQKDVILVASFRFWLAIVDSWSGSSYKSVWSSIQGYFRLSWHDRGLQSREVGQASHPLSWLLQIRDFVYQLLRQSHLARLERSKWSTMSRDNIVCYRGSLVSAFEIKQSSKHSMFLSDSLLLSPIPLLIWWKTSYSGKYYTLIDRHSVIELLCPDFIASVHVSPSRKRSSKGLIFKSNKASSIKRPCQLCWGAHRSKTRLTKPDRKPNQVCFWAFLILWQRRRNRVRVQNTTKQIVNAKRKPEHGKLDWIS